MARLKAWQLIEKGWCKGEDARDKYEMPISPTSRKAVKWCALGALERVYGEAEWLKRCEVVDYLKNRRGRKYQDVVDFNDDEKTRKRDVVSVLKKLDL